MDLEANHGLDPTQPAHVWLLHHLFLNAINQDANDWAETWNLHKLQIKKQRSPQPKGHVLLRNVAGGSQRHACQKQGTFSG